LIAKDGYIFIIPAFFFAILFWYFRLYIPFTFFLLLTLAFLFFFRNPSRKIPELKTGEVLSPADGKIIEIVNTEHGKRLSIFLAIYNVHVFRAPIGGKLSTVKLVKGKFHPAYKLEASTENERVKMVIDGESRMEFDVIAGVAARRIKAWKKEGTKVEAGELLGIVMFGSRTDIYIPENFELYVKVGDKVKGGLSKIGRFK